MTTKSMLVILGMLMACSSNPVETPDADADASTPDAEWIVDAGMDIGSDAMDAAEAGCAPQTDYTTDSKNCGACWHDCFGGQCVGGKCQALDLGQQSTVAVQGLFADSTGCWFTWVGTTDVYTDGVVKYIPNQQTAPITKATGLKAPMSVFSDGTNFYVRTKGSFVKTNFPPWNDKDGELLKCPVSGCSTTPTVIDSNISPGFELRANAKELFWTTGVWGTNQAFSRLLLSGGTATPFLSDVGTSWNVDSTNLTNASGTLYQKPLAGGSNLTIWPGALAAAWLVTNTNGVFWVDNNSQQNIKRCSLPDCYGGPTTYRTASTFNLLAESSDLYWIEAAGGFHLYTCSSSSATCSTPTTIAFTSLEVIYSASLSSSVICYTQGTHIFRLAR